MRGNDRPEERPHVHAEPTGNRHRTDFQVGSTGPKGATEVPLRMEGPRAERQREIPFVRARPEQRRPTMQGIPRVLKPLGQEEPPPPPETPRVISPFMALVVGAGIVALSVWAASTDAKGSRY